MKIYRWSGVAGWLTLIGSSAWLAKFVVIVASNGRTLDTGAAAWLLRLGLGCLLLGAPGFALWITRRSQSVTHVIAALLAPIIFIGSFLGIDMLTISVVGTRGPDYLAAEAGLVVSAAIWLLLGIWLLVRVHRSLQAHRVALPHA